MTPTAFRDELSRLRISQQEAARRLGVSDRTVRRWAAGHSEIKAHVEMALKALETA